MKPTLIKLISAASITVTFSLFGSLPASAQIENRSNISNRNFTPSALVSQAESGNLKNQGISGYGALKTQYRVHQVTAESLVQAGVDAGLIPTETLQDKGYLNAVNAQMRHRDR